MLVDERPDKHDGRVRRYRLSAAGAISTRGLLAALERGPSLAAGATVRVGFTQPRRLVFAP